MKKAVMIGAGQIGRGLIGMLLEQSGYSVTFADINMDVINDIKNRGRYTVHLMDIVSEEITCTNIGALNSLDPALVDVIKTADIVCTSVGLNALSGIAPVIANGITCRMENNCTGYCNIIACENAARGSSVLKKYVTDYLNEDQIKYLERYVGFPDCAVDRIIPPVKKGPAADVYVERYNEWDVERKGFKGDIPDICGMRLVDDLTAYLERKLYTLNGTNVVNGVYAYIKGYRTVNESLKDDEIYNQVTGQMKECCKVLEKRHGFTQESMETYCKSLIQRFTNPYIIDDVVRVAREPIRKLSANDRLIAPLTYAVNYGFDIPYYIKGAAIVLLYNNPKDIQSIQLQEKIKNIGVKHALEEISGISAESDVAAKIEQQYEMLRKQYFC